MSTCLSSSLRNLAVSGQSATHHFDKTPTTTVSKPSRMKIPGNTSQRELHANDTEHNVRTSPGPVATHSTHVGNRKGQQAGEGAGQDTRAKEQGHPPL